MARLWRWVKNGVVLYSGGILSALINIVGAPLAGALIFVAVQNGRPQGSPLRDYPVPVFLIAQLAVDKKFHRKGLGKICLIKALEHLWIVNFHMRAYAVIVDCLTDAAERFYSKYGFEKLTVHNGRTRMFLPMKTVERLFTDVSS